MKTIIVGAGISGLTTYLFLNKHLNPSHTSNIKIYEAYDTSKLYSSQAPPSDTFLVTAIGNALGIGVNGLNVLRRLDQSLFDETVARGCPVHSWRLTNARGWKLADIKMPTSSDGGASSIMIARQALWEVLRSRVPNEVIVNRKVVDVVIRKAKRNEVHFEDGSVEEADLVIGADGLRSIVRTSMFREELVVGGKDYITPRYEGLSGVGGFLESGMLTESGCVPGTMNLVFGPNGFFGYGIIDSENVEDGQIVPGKRGAWWSTYHEAECPDTKNLDKKAATEALKTRHSKWKNNTVKAVVQHISDSDKGVDDVYPTWTTPELPTWEKYGCVLVGDAAHALQPSSGQGTSQAFEDAEAFTLLLNHYFSITVEVSYMAAVEKASKEYVEMRRPRLNEIYVRTQQMSKMKGDQGFLMEMLTSAAIYTMTFFKDRYNKRLMEYDASKEVAKITREGQEKVALDE